MSIPELGAFIKSPGFLELCLAALLVGTGLASFWLGRMSVTSATRDSVRICTVEGSTLATEVRPPTPGPSHTLTQPAQAVQALEGEYVASREGEAYHLPWCSGAQRIKPENRVWFATQEEAQQAGYRPAANCKGL